MELLKERFCQKSLSNNDNNWGRVVSSDDAVVVLVFVLSVLSQFHPNFLVGREVYPRPKKGWHHLWMTPRAACCLCSSDFSLGFAQRQHILTYKLGFWEETEIIPRVPKAFSSYPAELLYKALYNTRLLNCYVWEQSVFKTKQLRRFIQRFKWV